MSDRETLEKHGYSYNPMSGSWIKSNSKISVAIYSIGDGVRVCARADKPTFKEAIEAGEK